MGKWLLPRDRKETRVCFSCGAYKMKSIFYEWYTHPSLAIGNELHGIICSSCAKREAGSNHWRRINGK